MKAEFKNCSPAKCSQARFKRFAGISGLILGSVFLCNPDIAVFDILPDFIGYAIIISSLANLADMFYQFDDAKEGFKKGMYISIAKLLSILVIFGVFDSSNTSMGLLLFTFIFAVLDIIFLLPAYKKLFEGFLYAAQRIESNSVFLCSYTEKGHKRVLEKCQKKGKRPLIITAKAYRLAIWFVIFKNILAVAPELTTLINNSQYKFIGLLRGFAVLISLIIGISFIVRMSRYLIAIKRDGAFIDGLKNKYEHEVMPKTHIFTSRKLCSAITFAVAAFLFSINVYNDEINVLPGFIFFALSLIYFAIVRKERRVNIFGIVLSIVGFAVSAAEWVMSVIFYTNHFVGEVNKFPHAFNEYYTMSAFSIAGAVIYIATVVLMLISLFDIFTKHTGKPNISEGVIIGNITHKDDRKDFKLSAILMTALCILAMGAYLFNIFASPFSIQFWMFEMSQMLDFAISVIFALYAAYILSNIKSSIKECYSLY